MHARHLALPLGDKGLRHAPKVFTMAIFEFSAGDVDRSLIMWHYHCNKIAVDVSRRMDRHSQAHCAYGQIGIDNEIQLITGA
jgi:hypothetical protein